MNTIQLETLSLISLLAFCVIGAFDGVYYHYYKYRLHQYEETKLEHYIHGARGVIFSPIALLFFVFDSKGVLLLLGLTLLFVDLILEVIDILVEKKSRENLGGISPGETLCHVFATGCRLLALGFIISTKPMESFTTIDLSFDLMRPSLLLFVGLCFSVLSLTGGAMHFLPRKVRSALVQSKGASIF